MNLALSRTLLCATYCIACLTGIGAATAEVNWRTNLDAAKIEAAKTNRFVLLHFWTPTCVPCMQLNQTVFKDPAVGPALEKHYVPVKIDASKWPAITNAFNVEVVPTEIILSPQGTVVFKPEIPRDAMKYISELSRLGEQFRQTGGGVPTGAASSQVHQAYASLPGNSIGQTNAGAGQGAPENAIATEAAAPVVQPAATVNPYASQQVATPVQAGAPNAGANVVADRYATPPIGTVAAAPVANQAQAAPIGGQTQTTPSSGVATGQPTPTQLANSNGVAAVQSPLTAAGPTAPTAVSQAAVTPTPRPAPQVGLEGFCPVTLRHGEKWLKGDQRVSIEHRGVIYYFATDAERAQFRSNPDLYSPVFNGLDPVLLIDEHRAVQGSRRFGFKMPTGGVYLFSSKETMARFSQTEEATRGYVQRIEAAMRHLDASNGGTVLR